MNPESMQEQIKSYEKHIPENLLKPWPELPEGYKSVFHHTSEENLGHIAQEGIRHFSERVSEEEMTKEQHDLIAFDRECDKLAEKMGINFQRSKSVFMALPPSLDKSQWSRFGDVPLEIKTDSRKTYVYDRFLHTLGALAYSLRTPEGRTRLDENHEFREGMPKREQLEQFFKENTRGEEKSWEEYIRQYISTRMSLNDYLSLTPEEQHFKMPEVAVPSPILPDFIRIPNQPRP